MIENFSTQWTNWAHGHGSITRNQAHGSPANLIDTYASVDIPECEGFGLSQFHIKGLRQDSLTRKNDSDLSMLKYASSAAHIAGKPYTSSETFTWLTEHFRTSLSQCKPDMDLMFVSGVNHMFFHGTPYSPKEAKWPGWKFYASIDMSPTNNIWQDAPAFFKYITRCQSFLQMGKPDNDFLVYLPVYDMWQEQPGRLLLFSIHDMAKRAPKFIETVHTISNCGYDMDYISDNFVKSTRCVNGKLLTKGGTSYKAIIIPAVKLMPSEVLGHLLKLAQAGATIIFTENYPQDVPGYGKLEARRKGFAQLQKQFPEIVLSMRRWQLLIKKGSSLQETTINLPWKKRCCSRRDENAVWLTMYPPLPCRWTSLFHLLIAGKRSKRLDNLSRSRRKCHAVQSDDGRKRESTNPQARRQNPSTPPTAFRRKCHPANFQPCPDRRCRMEIRSRTTCQPQP